MTTVSLRFAVPMPDVFDEHLDTAGLLWSRRRAALRSPQYTAADVVELDERIDAHFDGLTAAGVEAIPLLSAQFGDGPARAFAAASALLRLATPQALDAVLSGFEAAKGKTLESFRDALAHAPSLPLIRHLTALTASGPPTAGAFAAEALAFQGAIAPVAEHLERFIRADEPAARASAWRTVAYCGVAVRDDWYAVAFRDDEGIVRAAAFEAATWNRSPAFYPAARALAAEPTPEVIEPLVILGAVAPPGEYQLIEAVAGNPAAGANRARVIASFGHPYFLDMLLRQMEDPDPACAAAAGAAFERLTDRAPWSDRRATTRDVESAASEADAGEAVVLPDPALARKQWQELAPRLAQSTRICRGMDVSQPLSREQFAALDMDSRWEYCLRMRLFSGWQGTPLVLERYPQRF